MLRAERYAVNRKRVQRLMRRMGIAALGPKPKTTKPAPGHKVFPYLLRDQVIDRPNQVWAADITDLPIGRGFLYLVAIIDWTSRAVLVWRLSNTMDTAFCVDALDEALARFAKPDIFNTDQGSQVTSADFTGRLAGAGIRISMDGRGRWMDRRLHRTVVAVAEVRGRVSEGLHRRSRGARRDRLVDRTFTTAGGLIRRWPAEPRWQCGARASAGCWPATPKDMTVRLDDALASPTCPPRQQQQQKPRVA